MRLDFSKIAPSVALILVGMILVIIGGVNGIPIGNNQVTINETLRQFMFIIGMIVLIAGLVYIFMEMLINNPKKKDSLQENQKALLQQFAQEMNSDLKTGIQTSCGSILDLMKSQSYMKSMSAGVAKELVENETFIKKISISQNDAKNTPDYVKQLSDGISSFLRENSDWAAEALDRASIKLRGHSIFLDRMGHFYTEKETISKCFSPMIIERCQFFCENDHKVFLIIDSGTTLYPFFEKLGYELARRKIEDEDWLKNLCIVSNNLPGIESLMNEGRINPNDRYSKLAVETRLLPGEPLPVYSAVTGDETNKALNALKEENINAKFIVLTTGNWIRLRRSTPCCPVPLARGTGHFEIKQILINIADEAYVVTPLGKIFIDVAPDVLNKALGFRKKGKGKEQSYREVQIDDKQAASVRLVSTFRPDSLILHTHGTRLCTCLKFNEDESIEKLSERFRNAQEIDQVPHFLFEFDQLSKDPWEEYKTEFPHEHTHIPSFLKKYFGVSHIPKVYS